MNLQKIAEEVFDGTPIICPESDEEIGNIVITIKKDEVVCWLLECVICPETDCLKRIAFCKKGTKNKQKRN